MDGHSMKTMLLLIIAGAIGMSSGASAADGSVRPGGGTKATDAALLPAVKAGSANKNTSNNAALLPAVKAGSTNRNTSSDAALLPAVRPSSAAVKRNNADKLIFKQ
jgi:hypothetical protein